MDFAEVIIEWYKDNGRELPWRETRDPYKIWVSEVILQQTRVVQGLDYFYRFIHRFPDVRMLAEASIDEVMRYWQGLGYYSRARNLHEAAREIVRRWDGKFPEDYQEILSLKGVGEYTAAAICSFAWQLPCAVVDGNVFRVLARFFGIDTPIDSTAGKKEFAALAGELLDKKQPDVYNQALMDFGALQCTPQSPCCLYCPLQNGCRALAEGRVDALPVKKGKVNVKPRYFNYLDIHCKGRKLLIRREADDIWRNLYEYPMIETENPVDFAELQLSERYQYLMQGTGTMRLLGMMDMPKHILSHRVIYARFYKLEVDSYGKGMSPFLQIPEEEEENYAVPKLIDSYRKRVVND